MDLKKQHLLVLFAAGLVAKGVVKQLFGTNASLLVLVAIAVYYYKVKRESQNIYQDMVRLKRETASKLDVLERKSSTSSSTTSSTDYQDGSEDVTTTSIRPTHFKMNQQDLAMITDRMHQYSRKLSGSQRDRRKFLRRNRRRRPEEEKIEPQDADDEEEVEEETETVQSGNQLEQEEEQGATQLRQRFDKTNKTAAMQPLLEEEEEAPSHHLKAH